MYPNYVNQFVSHFILCLTKVKKLGYCEPKCYFGLLSGKESVSKQEIQEMRVRSLSWKDCLDEEMATHSSLLAWKTPWTEEPSRLQPTGLQRAGHD